MTIKALYPTVRPTLNLDFAKTKALDPRVTFSRASTATFTGANGLIQSAASNAARFDHNPATGESLGLLVEEARTNLLTYSQQFQSWTQYNSPIITQNATTAPDGSITGAKIASVNGGFSAIDGINGTNATLTVFAKAAEFRYLVFTTFDYGGAAIFDLQSGVVALNSWHPTINPGAATITALPNGWYRCCLASTIRVRIGATNTWTPSGYGFIFSNGNGTSGIYIWGAQLEAGSFPTSYIPTPATFTGRASTATFYDSAGVIQTAGNGVARSAAFFPDSSGVMRSAGLLLEAAGTNLVTQSQTFSDWTHPTGGGFTLTSNAGTAPDGTNTATKLVETATTGVHRASITLNSFGTGTISVFAKAAERSVLTIGTNDQGPRYFDLSSGTTPSANCKIEKLANGWYRCSAVLYGGPFSTAMIGVSTTTSTDSYTGNASSGILIWGAQAEQSSYATSYIPTVASTVTRAADTSTSATVTRAADVASMTGTNFSSWYNQSEGTICGKFLLESNRTSTRWLATLRSNSGLVNAFSVGRVSPDNIYAEAYFNNSAVYAVSAAFPSLRVGQIALAVKSGSIRGAFNGTLSTASSGLFGDLADGSMQIGRQFNGIESLCGTIARLTYYPVRLPDATLQAITAT